MITRIRYGKGLRARFDVATEARAQALRDLADMLTAAGKHVEAPTILRKAARCTDRELPEIMKFAEGLCAGKIKDKTVSQRTAKQLGSSLARSGPCILDLPPLKPPRLPGVYPILGFPGFVKIGRADSIAVRMATLQTAYPITLHLLAVLSLNPDDEEHFHARFGDDRLKGEWFTLSDTVETGLREARETVLLPESGRL